MNRGTRRLRDILGNIYFGFLGSLASVVGLLFFLMDRFKPGTLVWCLAVPVSGVTLAAIAIYSIAVRQENIQFRNLTNILHRINHQYRDALAAVFESISAEQSDIQLIDYVKESERKALKTVCECIARIFTAFTHTQCMVTVKLITSTYGKAFCETYIRSEENSERDSHNQRQFNIHTGDNTAFDRALLYAPGAISRFHSADLLNEKDYRNQRDNWDDFYRSVIVVPIRSVNRSQLGSGLASHDIGFLCVDTLSTNRLNDTWHVYLLASFADQMYNFLSLMRGKYVLRKQSPAGTQPDPGAQ